MSDRSDRPDVIPAAAPENPPERDDSERRKEVRFHIVAEAEVYDFVAQITVTGRCSDLSLGGCYVDTLTPFAIGSTTRVRIEHDAQTFEAAATVAYSHPSLGMGLAFTKIDSQNQALLRRWIAHLNGEPASQASASAAEQITKPAGDDSNARFVLNELLALLVRRKVLTESERADLVRKMFR